MSTPAPGAIIADRFRVLRPLGSGGAGSVFLVEQLSTGRPRALKLLHAGYAAASAFRARFEAEARITGRVESRHVVEVIDAGFDRDSGSPFIVMEYLPGETMADAISRGRRGVPFAAALLPQIGHALAAAHRAGIVHRDLKPDNVYLAEERDGSGFVLAKLLDFGIARLLDETQPTGVVGTPRYMAPEQFRSGGRPEPALDVWAFGLLAFEALAGEPYFAERDAGPLIHAVTLAPLELPSARLARAGVQAPPGFDAWCLRCLQRDPRQRFSDAGGALEALAPVLGAHAPVAYAPTARVSSEHRLDGDLAVASTARASATVTETIGAARPYPETRERPRTAEAGPPGARVRRGGAWLGATLSGLVVLSVAGTALVGVLGRVPLRVTLAPIPNALPGPPASSAGPASERSPPAFEPERVPPPPASASVVGERPTPAIGSPPTSSSPVARAPAPSSACTRARLGSMDPYCALTHPSRPHGYRFDGCTTEARRAAAGALGCLGGSLVGVTFCCY